MVTNIDTNVGKVLKALEAKGLAGNTIVVFLTDNGPANVRFNAGLRGWKASVYDGGIHVPCYIRWPGHLPAGGVVDRIAAHIDLAPTLLDACGVARPGRRTLRRQEPAPSAQGNPDRRLARSDSLFPVAPRRPARAWPGLRRAFANVQALAPRAAARRHQGAAARAL